MPLRVTINPKRLALVACASIAVSVGLWWMHGLISRSGPFPKGMIVFWVLWSTASFGVQWGLKTTTKE